MTDRVELEVDFRFEAAHLLPNVPPNHKCRRLHGHSFHCTVTVAGEVDPTLGWLMDYGDVREAIAPVRAKLDHHYLNEVEGLENPTSERLARWIWDHLTAALPQMTSVIVRETCTARCIYRGSAEETTSK